MMGKKIQTNIVILPNEEKEKKRKYPETKSYMHQLTVEIQLTASQGPSCLFTSQFGIKAAQADCKCLKGRQWISIIHGEHVFANLTKLENDFIVVRWTRLRSRRSSSSGLCGGDQLKILDGSNCHPPPEVEAPALQLLVPTGGLVLEN